jgi:hypothetical protein
MHGIKEYFRIFGNTWVVRAKKETTYFERKVDQKIEKKPFPILFDVSERTKKITFEYSLMCLYNNTCFSKLLNKL